MRQHLGPFVDGVFIGAALLVIAPDAIFSVRYWIAWVLILAGGVVGGIVKEVTEKP